MYYHFFLSHNVDVLVSLGIMVTKGRDFIDAHDVSVAKILFLRKALEKTFLHIFSPVPSLCSVTANAYVECSHESMGTIYHFH